VIFPDVVIKATSDPTEPVLFINIAEPSDGVTVALGEGSIDPLPETINNVAVLSDVIKMALPVIALKVGVMLSGGRPDESTKEARLILGVGISVVPIIAQVDGLVAGRTIPDAPVLIATAVLDDATNKADPSESGRELLTLDTGKPLAKEVVLEMIADGNGLTPGKPVAIEVSVVPEIDMS
jgi:hypothetical protein